MPSKKKKYNARFPAGRIKRIMQSDEEIGKVAQAVPVIISRTLELFVESLLTKTLKITNSRNAKTLSPSHMKQCIMAESRFDFLRELVKNVPDISVAEEAANDVSSPEQSINPDTPYDLSMPSTSSIQNLPLSIGTTSSSYANNAETSRVRNGVSSNKGQTSITSTTSATVTSSIPSFSDSSTTPIDKNSPSYMKRQLNCNNRLRRCLETQADSTTTTNTTTNSSSSAEIAVPSSVIRHTSSELAATAISSDDTKELITPPKPGRNSPPTEATLLAIDYTKQHHQLSEHDIPTNYSIKRSTVQRLEKTNLQSKSTLIPAASIMGEQLKQNQPTHQNRPPSKQTAIPAPVFHIDFCNKPVVKIDYSNLTPIDDAMRDLTEDSNSKLQQSPNIDSSSSLATTTTASLSSSSMPSSLKCSPIFNIDLSNIISTSNTANRPTLTMSNSLKKSAIQANAKVASALNNSSYLELDEDYDNI